MKRFLLLVAGVFLALGTMYGQSGGGTGAQGGLHTGSNSSGSISLANPTAAITAFSPLTGCGTLGKFFQGATGTCIVPPGASPYYAVATGSADAYAVTISGLSLTAGSVFSFQPNFLNTTTTPTLALNGGSAITITRNGQYPLVTGDLGSNAVAVVLYDGTYLELQNPQVFATFGTGGSVLSLYGSSTGVAQFVTQAHQGSPSIVVPTNSGTLVDSASSPLSVNAATGNLSIASIPLTTLATQAANTELTNPTSGSAAPTANAIPTGIGYYTQNSGHTQATGHQMEVPLACADVSGSGTAQSCSTGALTYTPAAADCVLYVTTTTNSGTGLTTNINSLGAKSIAIPGASGWTTTLTANIIPANKIQVLCYDGTNWNDQQTGTLASGGGVSFPQAVTGTVTSGGAVYASDTTHISVGALLGANQPVLGGGAGAAPFTSANVWISSVPGPSSLTTLNGNLTSAATSVVLTSATGYASTGTNYILVTTNAGGQNEIIGCTSLSTNTLSGCSRNQFGSSNGASTINNGSNVAFIDLIVYQSTSTMPLMFITSTGTVWINPSQGSLNVNNNQQQGGTAVFQGITASGLWLADTAQFTGDGGTGARVLAGNGNAAGTFYGSGETRNVATQSITSTGTFATSATLITAAKTLTYPLNSAAASATVHGQMETDCDIFYQVGTGSVNVQFGVKNSAAATAFTVFERDYAGVAGALSASSTTAFTSSTTITQTTNGSGITPTSTATTYTTQMHIVMNPGVTNSPVLTLYANSASANTITIEPQTGCNPWR